MTAVRPATLCQRGAVTCTCCGEILVSQQGRLWGLRQAPGRLLVAAAARHAASDAAREGASGAIALGLATLLATLLAHAGDAKPKPEAPWLLRVLGLGDSASADDDSFWEDKVAPPTQPSSTSPSGAEDVAGDGQGAEEPAEEEDDTEGIDTLEDLLS